MRILMRMDNPVKWLRGIGQSIWSNITNRIAEFAVSLFVFGVVTVSGLIEGIPVAVLIVLGLMAIALSLWIMLLVQRWRFKRLVDAERRQERKECVKRWREFLAAYDRERDGPLARTVAYSEMRPDLQPRVIAHIEGRTITVKLGNRGGSLPMLLDDVARLEREWNLI